MIYGFVVIAIVLCGMAMYVRALKQKVDSISKIADVPDTVYYFGPYMEIVELPILFMTNNDKKLGFILDSGSNGCHINREALEGLELEESKIIDKASETATGGGVVASSNEKCTMKLQLDNVLFTVPFSVEDMKQQFDFIKKTDGIQLHGILGSNFLAANGWVIDFANKIAYMKNKK